VICNQARRVKQKTCGVEIVGGIVHTQPHNGSYNLAWIPILILRARILSHAQPPRFLSKQSLFQPVIQSLHPSSLSFVRARVGREVFSWIYDIGDDTVLEEIGADVYWTNCTQGNFLPTIWNHITKGLCCLNWEGDETGV